MKRVAGSLGSWVARGCTATASFGKQLLSNRVTQQPVLALLTTLALLSATPAMACPVCYGDPNSLMVKGTNNGVWFLLGIVAFVQLGFVALFYSFWRRAKALKKHREQFHLIPGGAR